MAGAKKHMERSHKTYKKDIDFSDFQRKAQFKKQKKEQAGFFAKLFHRTTNK